MNKKIQIIQKHLCINYDYEYSVNYLIIIEMVDYVPQRVYLVNMHNFSYYNENMRYYVINQN